MMPYEAVPAPPPNGMSSRVAFLQTEYHRSMDAKGDVRPGYYYHTIPVPVPDPPTYYSYHGPAHPPPPRSLPPLGMSESHEAYTGGAMHDMQVHPVSLPPLSRYPPESMDYVPMRNMMPHELPPPPMPHDDGANRLMMPHEPRMPVGMVHEEPPPLARRMPTMPQPRSSSVRRMAMPPMPPSHMAEPPASKRDRKRKEVLERLDRVHWDVLEHREPIYQDAFMGLTSTYHALMMRPSYVREYAMELADQTVWRERSLREASLYFAFMSDRSQHTYDTESTKAEDEARISKRNIRDKMLGVIEERKKRLKEERDSGEFAGDPIVESTQRPHSTRQLRNKDGSAGGTPARIGQLLDYDDVLANGYPRIAKAVAQLLGWTVADATTTITSAKADNDAHGMLLCKSASDGSSIRLPLYETFASQSSLLAGINLAASGKNSSKKKEAASKLSSRTLSSANSNATSTSASPDRSDDEDAVSATPLLSSGGGRLRWDTARCLSQLTAAKDLEVEADLIHIHQIGTKRRRR